MLRSISLKTCAAPPTPLPAVVPSSRMMLDGFTCSADDPQSCATMITNSTRCQNQQK